MSDCIFCKIAAGAIPCHKLFESDHALAFLTIEPVRPGHALVIPKDHFADCLSTPDDVMAELHAIAKRVAAASAKATGASGFNVTMNCGPSAGQVVMHTHMHVIPRVDGDALPPWPKRMADNEELAKVAADIVAALS